VHVSPPDQVDGVVVVSSAAQQAWPPFVLVAGLLLIGLVAHVDGLFERAGRLLEQVPGPPVAMLAGGIGLVAVVTAVLNLDTAVVFLTPVLVVAARSRGVDEEPFLYAAVYLANASSLYLPGSNLTNLLVLDQHPLPGGTFASELFLPALAATVATSVGLCLLFRRELGGQRRAGAADELVRGDRSWTGAAAAGVAAGLTLALAHPALPVLGVGVLAVGVEIARRRLDVRRAIRAVGPRMLGLLFVASVGLGSLARAWGGPARLLAGAGRFETAGIGSAAAVGLNNLPAAVLLSGRGLPHPRALLIGLNIGPNLAVTGSLSAYLWLRAARQAGAEPSVSAYSRRGLVLAPVGILAALVTAAVLGSPG
jgi:arsenical pump membrane protein